MTGDRLGSAVARAIGCERTVQRVYEDLARLFSHVPELARLWRDMAADEQEHVDLLNNVGRCLSTKALSTRAPSSLLERIDEAVAFLDQDLLASVKDLDDAYELAHEMEAFELVSLFQVLSVGGVPGELRDRFLSLQIDEHIDRLEAVKADFPTTGDRDKISAHWDALSAG